MRQETRVAVGANSSGVQTRFPCFDGLRAVAALSVFTFHFLGLTDPSWFRGAVREWVWRLGLQGVGIFFVISGFLLYRPFVDAAFRGRPSPSIAQFWKRRFARIFPAYWMALTAFVYGFGLFHIHGIVNFVTYYALLQNYRGRYQLVGLGIAWTLVIEVSFYLALPLISRAVRAIAGSSASADRVLRAQVGVVASLAMVGVLVKVLNVWVLSNAKPTLGAWLPIQTLGWSLLGYLDWFAIGMTFAIISVRSARAEAVPRPISWFARHPAACWLFAIGCYAAQTGLHLGTGPTSPPPTSLAQFVLPFLVALAAAGLVFPAIFGAQDPGVIRSLLRSKPLDYLGRISYGIYLWHFIIIRLSVRWVADNTMPNILLLRLATVAFLTVGVASASFYLVERPIISLAQHRGARTP
jgi:peptidoglycan/LPS O-acetylase OafA/YrhL